MPSTANINDELVGLLVKCRQGDKQAFSFLYQKTSSRLNGIAYRITKNVDTANEVLQEAFIQIWQNCEQYQAEKSEAFTWLASIVRYRAYDKLRYDKRRQQQNMVELSEHTDIGLNEFDAYSTEFTFDVHSEAGLHKCLETLEKKQSKCILMAYLYGYSREEISSYFDTPINTIKSWIKRGLGRLQKCLNQ
jgi:RNA polymerase sigma-70 factor (ECF subfamily)